MVRGFLSGVVCALALFAQGAEMPEAVRHRREVRAALADAGTRQAALEAALSDPDVLVRRHALALAFADCGGDEAKVAALAKRFADEKEPSVRRFVKALQHKGGLYVENNPLSLSEQNDHVLTKLATVRPKGGVFTFEQPLPKYEAVELWFGRPKKDLYVWINDHYVGQFDSDYQKGNEFRLDVTTLVDEKRANTIVVRGADNEPVKARFTVEVLTWK